MSWSLIVTGRDHVKRTIIFTGYLRDAFIINDRMVLVLKRRKYYVLNLMYIRYVLHMYVVMNVQ